MGREGEECMCLFQLIIPLLPVRLCFVADNGSNLKLNQHVGGVKGDGRGTERPPHHPSTVRRPTNPVQQNRATKQPFTGP